MLLRLAYLGITNAFGLLWLLPGSDRDKDAEILALRHQLAVLHRQLGQAADRVRPSRSGLAGRAATPTPPIQPAPTAPAGTARHDPALAPRPVCSPPRDGITATPAGPATYAPIDPRAGVAPGRGEPLVGLSAGARGTAHLGSKSRRIHGLGNPARGRRRPRPGAGRHHLVAVPAVAGRRIAGR